MAVGEGRIPASDAANDDFSESAEEVEKRLSRLLFPPSIQEALHDVRHLIVVPVLNIGIVPFPMLEPWGEGGPLVEYMSVSVAPSLFDIAQVLQKDELFRWGKGDSLVVGNPELIPSDGWFVPELPGAEEEALLVAEALGSAPFIGQDATKKNVLANIYARGVLYFATHGISDPENPLDGGFLMLAGDSFEEGWLTVREIQNLRLNAKLAVLSACQTGLGQTHSAGIIGLARSFQLAGVPRVVMSLWNVDDEATTELMSSFMSSYSGDNPSEALRRAMIKTREDFRDHAFWASFVIFGTPR
jgi:CHAT domain-containing protein